MSATTDQENKKITDFLDLNISKEKLANALEVLKQFKNCESMTEWMAIPFSAWSKLEQLEEFLEFLVNNKPLANDTLEYIQESYDVESNLYKKLESHIIESLSLLKKQDTHK